MIVSLLTHTPEPELLICRAAHVCYSDKPISRINVDDSEQIISRLIHSGHLSVLEHVSFSFGIESISRVCLAQLTRHRLASFSVKSQRYVEVEGEFVSPIEYYPDELFRNYEFYVKRGIPKEDARYILPQGVTTSLVMTMNARELLHFFSIRCCRRAQWEIRELAEEMLRLVKPVAPNVFRKAGAFCDQNGFCQEAQPCGREVPHKNFLFSLYDFWKEQR